MMDTPTTALYTLRLLTTLDTVELGARYVAVETATGTQAYTFSKMSRRQCVAFLRPFGTVAGVQA